MKKIFQIMELIIDENNDEHGVYAISLVDEPAIEEFFYSFNKEYDLSFSTIDEEQRMVVGPALIPNKMILRKVDGEYLYVFMNKETIKKTAQRFLTFGKQNNSTMEHQVSLKDVSVVESWIIEDKANDKSNMYGFDLPLGTWMLSSKINNDAVWESIKKGDVRGYSIEGNYSNNMIERSSSEFNKEVELDVDTIELLGTDGDIKLYEHIIEILGENQEHPVPEAEQDWVYMIHHMHKPDNPKDMEDLHHCILWSKENETGDSFEQYHVEDKQTLLHALDTDVKTAPDVVLDHLNNKYPIEIKEINEIEYAIINKPKIDIKHDD